MASDQRDVLQRSIKSVSEVTRDMLQCSIKSVWQVTRDMLQRSIKSVRRFGVVAPLPRNSDPAPRTTSN